MSGDGNHGIYHEGQLVERSSYVPRKDRATPVPDWKKQADIRDVLPHSDPGRAR